MTPHSISPPVKRLPIRVRISVCGDITRGMQAWTDSYSSESCSGSG